MLIKQELGLQHQDRACLACSLAWTSNTCKSTPRADRNLAHTLFEMLGETANPKLWSLCKEIPNLTQLASDFTASLAPCHQRNHLLITLSVIRRLSLFQRQELNLGLSLNYPASTSHLFYTLKTGKTCTCVFNRNADSAFWLFWES